MEAEVHAGLPSAASRTRVVRRPVSSGHAVMFRSRPGSSRLWRPRVCAAPHRPNEQDRCRILRADRQK
jgi:hypothetical protein